MKKISRAGLCLFVLASGCTNNKVRFGKYSMSGGTFNSVMAEVSKRGDCKDINYQEMIRFCKESDKNCDGYVNQKEADEGIKAVVSQIKGIR